MKPHWIEPRQGTTLDIKRQVKYWMYVSRNNVNNIPRYKFHMIYMLALYFVLRGFLYVNSYNIYFCGIFLYLSFSKCNLTCTTFKYNINGIWLGDDYIRYAIIQTYWKPYHGKKRYFSYLINRKFILKLKFNFINLLLGWLSFCILFI